MSQSQVDLCNLLLQEHFGNIVATVGTLLASNGAMTKLMLTTETNLSANEVKKSLTILIFHNICLFERSAKGALEYFVDRDAILSRLRYPRYIYAAKMTNDTAAELIVEEILQHGRCQWKNISEKVMTRLNEELEAEGSEKITATYVKEKFTKLVTSRFIKRCPLPDCGPDKKVLRIPPDTESLFVPPSEKEEATGKRKFAGDQSDQPRKKVKTTQTVEPTVYWCCNSSEFHTYLRNRAFVQAITSRIDANAGEIVNTILNLTASCTGQYSTVTTPISVNEIKQGLPKDQNISRTSLDQYLKILIDDSSEIVNKVDESGGGMYSINILKGLKSLCKAHIESVIRDKYGSKSLRIFRILLSKQHVEQKQIEECAMVNIKEAKLRLYNLYTDGFVTATELCKTPDHAPARTTYLFNVELNNVAQMIIERCYKAIHNSMERRNYELKENKRLLDKQQRVEAIIASLSHSENDVQRDELEQLISPAEKARITQVTANIKKLELSELQTEETLFILQEYINYVAYSKMDTKN